MLGPEYARIVKIRNMGELINKMAGIENLIFIILIFLIEGISFGIVGGATGLRYMIKTTNPAPKRTWIRIFLKFFGYTLITFWAMLVLLCGAFWFLLGL